MQCSSKATQVETPCQPCHTCSRSRAQRGLLEHFWQCTKLEIAGVTLVRRVEKKALHPHTTGALQAFRGMQSTSPSTNQLPKPQLREKSGCTLGSTIWYYLSMKGSTFAKCYYLLLADTWSTPSLCKTPCTSWSTVLPQCGIFPLILFLSLLQVGKKFSDSPPFTKNSKLCLWTVSTLVSHTQACLSWLSLRAALNLQSCTQCSH